MASSFPTIPSKIAPPRLTPWLRFSKRDTRIRTISRAASATRPERFAARSEEHTSELQSSIDTLSLHDALPIYRTAEAYAMVTLFETGYADQNDIARCFGYSARTLRRYQERLKAGGLSALVRPEGRPAGSPSGRKKNHERNQTILRLKAKGMSNRWIASRLGLSEKTVRKSLRRLGWKSDPEPDLPFLPKADSQ